MTANSKAALLRVARLKRVHEVQKRECTLAARDAHSAHVRIVSLNHRSAALVEAYAQTVQLTDGEDLRARHLFKASLCRLDEQSGEEQRHAKVTLETALHKLAAAEKRSEIIAGRHSALKRAQVDKEEHLVSGENPKLARIVNGSQG